MSNLANIRLNRKKPLVCVPCEGETVGDICYRCQQIMEEPHDLIEFNAGKFNGMPNLSQLWNALLMIAQVTKEEPFIFTCHIKDLPEYYQTERDYRDILTFGIRSGLADIIEMDEHTDPDTLADLAEQCNDTGLIPLIAIHFATAPTAAAVTERLTSLSDLETMNFRITFPAATADDIRTVQEGVRDFLSDNYEYKVVINPTGPVAKAELLAGNTFDSPILYTEIHGGTDDLPSSQEITAILKEKGMAVKKD